MKYILATVGVQYPSREVIWGPGIQYENKSVLYWCGTELGVVATFLS